MFEVDILNDILTGCPGFMQRLTCHVALCMVSHESKTVCGEGQQETVHKVLVQWGYLKLQLNFCFGSSQTEPPHMNNWLQLHSLL